MSSTIETYNGYEAFGLCGASFNESIEFREYRADLGDGYRHQNLYGSSLGTKSWAIGFKNIKGGSADIDIVLPNGVSVNMANYLWDLFCRTKRTGDPFLIKSPRNDQYYLADFSDSKLTYERFLTKLYNSSLNLSEVRIPNVSVFDPSKLQHLEAWWKGSSFEYFSFIITDETSNAHDLAIQNDVVGNVDAYGNDFAQFSTTTNDGYINAVSDSIDIYDLFIVMKMRENTFSNTAGVFTANSTVAALVGASGTTKFTDFSFGPTFQYKKNGVEYDSDDQQAPMNEVGLVHCRWEDGLTVANLQIGKDRGFTGRYAELDLYEVLIMRDLHTDTDLLELEEHLMSIYRIS